MDAASGKQLLFILPQDIIDNTIKAFSTSATSATGYGSLGPPSGRYFAPANGPDCIQVVTGDCAPRDHYVTGPKVVTLRSERRQTHHARRPYELRVPGRDAQRVQQHQLHPGGADGQQRDDQPGDRRAARRQQHAESGRTV